MARAAAHGVDFESVGRSSRPTYTVEQVVNGCAGLNQYAFAAALFTLAGDDSVRGVIRYWLESRLIDEVRRQRWAEKVQTGSGRENVQRRLVELFLLEERQPAIVRAAPVIRLVYVDVDEATWRRKLSHQYGYVASEYHRRLIDAEEHIRRKLRADHEA